MSDEQTKAREFWINDFMLGPDESISQTVVVDMVPNCGLVGEDKTHVIEYSAYDQMKKERNLLQAEVERLKEYEFMYKSLSK